MTEQKHRPELTIIVPCYNEQDVLPFFYERTSEVLRTHHIDHEFLMINDGSADNTLDVITRLADQHPEILYISLSRNFGKEAALYAGFCNYHGRYVAIMDADLQDPPEMLPEMLAKVKSGEYDCAAARRIDRTGEPKIRSVFSHFFYKMINALSDTKIEEGARDFRLMSSDMADAVVRMAEYNRFSKGIFSWVGFRTFWFPYENQTRAAGGTKWNFLSLFKYAADGIFSFSQVPLALASWSGIAMTGFSFFALLFIIIRKLIFDDPVAGWASTICVIIFIGGLQLFFLGIIGQYLAKIYLETKNRPHYIAAKSNIPDLRNMK